MTDINQNIIETAESFPPLNKGRVRKGFLGQEGRGDYFNILFESSDNKARYQKSTKREKNHVFYL
jgi:hypothetical protein